MTINTLEVLPSDVYLPKINCENGGQIGFNVYDSEGKIITSQPLIVKEYYHPKLFLGEVKYVFRPQVILNELKPPSGFYTALPILGENFPLYEQPISFYYNPEFQYFSVCEKIQRKKEINILEIDSNLNLIYFDVSLDNFNGIDNFCLLNLSKNIVYYSNGSMFYYEVWAYDITNKETNITIDFVPKIKLIEPLGRVCKRIKLLEVLTRHGIDPNG